MVSIPACHAGDPGSIPGREDFVLCSFVFVVTLVVGPRCLARAFFFSFLLTLSLFADVLALF